MLTYTFSCLWFYLNSEIEKTLDFYTTPVNQLLQHNTNYIMFKLNILVLIIDYNKTKTNNLGQISSMTPFYRSSILWICMNQNICINKNTIKSDNINKNAD